MKIKTTMRYHLMPIRMTGFKNTAIVLKLGYTLELPVFEKNFKKNPSAQTIFSIMESESVGVEPNPDTGIFFFF